MFFQQRDFSPARVLQVPAKYMNIIQSLIPAINLKHKVLCQSWSIPHCNEAAGGAAWRMGRSHGRCARALPSLSFDKLAPLTAPKAAGSGEKQPHSSDSLPYRSHRNIGLGLLFFYGWKLPRELFFFLCIFSVCLHSEWTNSPLDGATKILWCSSWREENVGWK